MGDPIIDIEIETKFQGRQVQPNVTSLISNQIRKAIRRKHTFPNYKLRYKPFFKNSHEETLETNEIPQDGHFEVNIVELTRLSFPSNNMKKVYCAVTLGTLEHVTARQYDEKNILISLDVEIHRANDQHIGIVFKQTHQHIVVESVMRNSPAMRANIFEGDALISIEGKEITNIHHIAKVVKTMSRVFTMRIERKIRGQIKDAGMRDLDENSDIALAPTFIYEKRENSTVPGTINNKGDTKSEFFEHSEETVFEQYQTPQYDASSFITLHNIKYLKPRSNALYLNLNIFGISNEDSILLGYLNIPVRNILANFTDSTLKHFVDRFQINPPDTPNL